MGEVYVFKAKLKRAKRLWRIIEIGGNQTLATLDGAIQDAFDHEWGHLSEFTIRGMTFGPKEAAAETEFDRTTDVKINSLDLRVKEPIKYIYDFGDYIEHIIELLETKPKVEGQKYPQITGRNKPKYTYCEKCGLEGAVAKWWCSDCELRLCDNCAEEHEGHETYEIPY